MFYIANICIIYIYICKRIVKLICHRRSNMLRVSQCCVIERVIITALSFFFFFRSPRSSALIHIERVFPDYFSIFKHAKFCFRHTTNIFRKESNSIPPRLKRDNFTYDIYVSHALLSNS